jgi:hypothetical protein
MEKLVLFFQDEIAVQKAIELFEEFFVKKYYDEKLDYLCHDAPFILTGERGWNKPALGIEYSPKAKTWVRGFIAYTHPELVLD